MNVLIGPYETNRCYFGDVLDLSRALPNESVHCIVTSPAYWGLRSYLPEDHPDKAKEIGTEATPEEYVDRLVAIFRELRRALREDGTLWLNLGDCYCTVPHGPRGENWSDEKHPIRSREAGTQMNRMPQKGLKHKDLVGIPWSVAFALRADEWYLRKDIIWAKPNPLPESVTDRPTTAHEYLFLLSKSERYFYNGDAIKEKLESDPRSWGRHSKKDPGAQAVNPRPIFGLSRGGRDGTEWGNGETRNKRSVWTVATKPYPEAHFATFPPDLIKPCILAGCPEDGIALDPFLGSGTTGQVCQDLGRAWLGFDLNDEYAPLIEKRTRQRGLF